MQHAASEDDAVEVAGPIARSNLFKCAIFGSDPNWGRVLAAIGTTTPTSSRTGSTYRLNGVQVCRDGGIGDPRKLVDLSGREVTVEVDLRNGRHGATIWTNDLTYDYVKENAEYSTDVSPSGGPRTPSRWSRRPRSSPRRCPGWRRTPARPW